MGNNTSGAFSIGGNMTTNFTGTIRVTDDSVGSFRFYGSSGSSTATFDMGNATVYLCSKGGGTFNLGALAGGGAATLRGNSGSVGTNTYIIGGNNLSTTFSGAILDGIGSGSTPTTSCAVSLVKTGTGTLTLNGATNFYTTTVDDDANIITNYYAADALAYSGSTIISNGVLALVVPSALTNSTYVTLAGTTAVVDATSIGYLDSNSAVVTNGVFEVISGQTLAGIGTILASNVLADSGSIVSPGLPVGTLTASQKIELAGQVGMNINAANSPNCSEIVSPSITVDSTATLIVTNLGSEAGATFHLFSQAVTGFASVTLPTLTGTNSWVNNLAVDGSITLLAVPLVTVNTNAPYMTNTFDSGSGTLTLSWPADGYMGSWHLQSQTNTSSAGLTTNWVDWAGSSATNKVVVTVDKTKGTVFFRLVYP
jgi:autotransporter-associated beta strand protein